MDFKTYTTYKFCNYIITPIINEKTYITKKIYKPNQAMYYKQY